MRPTFGQTEPNLTRMKTMFGPPARGFEQMVNADPTRQMPPGPAYIPPEIQETEPQNQSLQRFLDMATPERQDPSLLSKIGASMMSFSQSPENVDKALYAPYYRQVADYNNQTGNLLKGATIEASQLNNQGLNDYRRGQLQLGEGRLNVSQDNAETARIRARNAETLSGQPNVRVKLGKGGQPDIWYDSKSGKQLMTTPSGTMDPVAQYKMEQEGRIDIEDMREDAAQKRTNTIVAGQNARDNPPAPQSATQQEQEIENRAARLLRINPDMAKWITKNPNTGQWDVAPVEGAGWTGFGGNGLTKEVRDQIVNFLNTGAAPSQSPQSQNIPPANGVPMTGGNNTINQSPIGGQNPDFGEVKDTYTGFGPKPGGIQLSRPPGDTNDPMGFQSQKVKVMKDGKTTTVSQRNLAKAQADGWKVVQ